MQSNAGRITLSNEPYYLDVERMTMRCKIIMVCLASTDKETLCVLSSRSHPIMYVKYGSLDGNFLHCNWGSQRILLLIGTVCVSMPALVHPIKVMKPCIAILRYC